MKGQIPSGRNWWSTLSGTASLTTPPGRVRSIAAGTTTRPDSSHFSFWHSPATTTLSPAASPGPMVAAGPASGNPATATPRDAETDGLVPRVAVTTGSPASWADLGPDRADGGPDLGVAGSRATSSVARPVVARARATTSTFLIRKGKGWSARRPRPARRTSATIVAMEVASRELRNNTRALLDRVGAGESVTITVDGLPVAVLQPLSRRPRWLSREEFARRVVLRQADAGLTQQLGDLAPDTTDDVPLS